MEQKNGAVVRRTVGYRRFEGLEAAAALARLYAALRLFVNFFQPSFKLAEKARDGAKVRKRYHPPATPCQRLLADPRDVGGDEGPGASHARDVGPGSPAAGNPRGPAAARRDRRQPRSGDDSQADRADTGAIPLRAAHGLAGGRGSPDGTPEAESNACGVGPIRSRRSTVRLREWFEAEPWRTSRELLERLQNEHPGVYPDKQLRTLQRRVKAWRRTWHRKWSSAWRPRNTSSSMRQWILSDEAIGTFT